MSLPDLVVKMSAKDRTQLSKLAKSVLAMKEEDPEVKPVRLAFPCIEGEFDVVSFVIVPPVIKESKGIADRTFTRKASFEEDLLGAESDNEQLFRVKDGVEQRRVGGVWVKSLGVTEGKSSIPAHIHVFGHKDGIVMASLGYVNTYTSSDLYIVGVMTTYGPQPRSVRVVTGD